MTYECLLLEAEKEGLEIYEHHFTTARLKGLCIDNIITLNSSIETETEKLCVLAEEMGHYHTTFGDILNKNKTANRKQEKRAMNWAYDKLVSLDKLINAYKSGVRNQYELAESLGITEEFIVETIEHYKEKYGLYAEYDKYIVYFEPLNVFRKLKMKQIKKLRSKKVGIK